MPLKLVQTQMPDRHSLTRYIWVYHIHGLVMEDPSEDSLHRPLNGVLSNYAGTLLLRLVS